MYKNIPKFSRGKKHKESHGLKFAKHSEHRFDSKLLQIDVYMFTHQVNH